MRELWRRRDFAREMAKTSLQSQHFNTAFGQLWLVLNPLLLAGVYFVLVDILRGGASQPGFFAHLLAGIFAYHLVSDAVRQAVKSVTGGGRLILNTAFPRALLPLSSVITAFMRFLPCLFIYIPVHLISGLPVNATLLWVFPLVALLRDPRLGHGDAGRGRAGLLPRPQELPAVRAARVAVRLAGPVLRLRGAREVRADPQDQPARRPADRLERRASTRASRPAASRCCSPAPGRSRSSSPARCSSSPGSVSSLSVSDDDPRIRVENVSVTYRTSLESAPTLRSTVTRLGRREKIVREIEALKNVSFDVPHGQVLGVVGANGAGKSTLMRTVAGILPPNEGRVEVHGRVSTLLALGVGFNRKLTGRQNVVLGGLAAGLSRELLKEKYDEIVAFAELEDFMDMPMRTYSSGMYGRLAFAVAVHMDPDILLIDEALSVGDARFRKKSFRKMRQLCQQDRTILLVSHALGSIVDLCDQAIWMHKGELRMADDAAVGRRRLHELPRGRRGSVRDGGRVDPRLTLEAEEFRRLGYRIVDALADRFEGLADAPVGLRATRAEMEERLREPLPEQGGDPDAVLDAVLRDVLPPGAAHRPPALLRLRARAREPGRDARRRAAGRLERVRRHVDRLARARRWSSSWCSTGCARSSGCPTAPRACSSAAARWPTSPGSRSRCPSAPPASARAR